METKKLDLMLAYEHLSISQQSLVLKLIEVPVTNIWHPDGEVTSEVKKDIIDSMTRLCKYPNKEQKDPAPVAFLRVNEETLASIIAFNQAKEKFEASVAAFKGRDKKTNKLLEGNRRHLKRILEQAVEFNKHSQSTLSGTGLADLCLKTCYRSIRVLDETLTAINIKKEARHLRTHNISRNELHQLVFEMQEQGISGPMIAFNQTSDSEFAIAKKTTERYMINTQYAEEGRFAETSPMSGPIVSTCNRMPSITFNRTTENVRSRAGRQVDITNKFIPKLSCYRYKQAGANGQ